MEVRTSFDNNAVALPFGSAPEDPRQHPYRPLPDPVTGGLTIDPDVVLKAKKFNLALSFYYSSFGTINGPYGQSRSASVNAYVASHTADVCVDVVRGNMYSAQYSKVGTVGGITTYTAKSGGIVNTVTFDGTKFTEYFNTGAQMVYQAQVAGGSPVTHQLIAAVDASGVVQTYSYGSGAEAGLLKTITLPGGNAVTFLYTFGSTTSLLNAVQDWSNRRWTFAYDSSNNLTTLTTPLGCQTLYSYLRSGLGPTLVHTIEDPLQILLAKVQRS